MVSNQSECTFISSLIGWFDIGVICVHVLLVSRADKLESKVDCLRTMIDLRLQNMFNVRKILSCTLKFEVPVRPKL